MLGSAPPSYFDAVEDLVNLKRLVENAEMIEARLLGGLLGDEDTVARWLLEDKSPPRLNLPMLDFVVAVSSVVKPVINQAGNNPNFPSNCPLQHQKS
jgi:hypothetical protein